MKKFIYKIFHNNKGMSLIEIIISVAIITIVASAFAAATLGGAQANIKNSKRQDNRESYISELDSKTGETYNPSSGIVTDTGYTVTATQVSTDDPTVPGGTIDVYSIRKKNDSNGYGYGYKTYAKRTS